MKKKDFGKLESFYTGKRALLLGNGINLLSNATSWEDLLRSISEEMQVDVQINRNKSYPLIFEEILFRCPGDFLTNLRRLKELIALQYQNLIVNEFHNQIMQLNVEHYLSTNYDYSLERVFNPNFNQTSGNTTEWKYSLFRVNIPQEKKRIWHIHGELNDGVVGETRYAEETIMIGNEHYGDYHRKVHEFIKPPGGIINGLNNEKDSWVKKFFTHDLHIIGLGFDFSETHLWWLLNYRARIKKEYGSIPNKIYFHFPSFNRDSYSSKNQLFEALDVIPEPTVVQRYNEANKYHRYWEKLINRTLPNHL